MRKNILTRLVVAAVSCAMLCGLTACAKTGNQGTTNAPTTEEATDESTATDDSVVSYPVPDGYELVWADEFDGETLDMKNWNYETHMPGWVNHELQAYVINEDNIYVKDGKLVIQPLKNDNKYTSGRINTRKKHEFQYGIIEARIKVPKGKGFLPAFWMMPGDESYGAWPRCGEIDIMEVVGSATKVSYSTLHFGMPHTEKQGQFRLTDGLFSDSYHVFRLEWLPDKMNFYVDGELFHTVSDWFTKTADGELFAEYPAPYDTPFYIIFNVAVGGDWPGKPNDSTPFDETGAMFVDYVRVYQNTSIE